MVDERYTTMKCCITGKLTKRTPDVRDWDVNGRNVLRDLNSSVNIGRKLIEIDEEFVSKVNLTSIDVEINNVYNKKINTCLAQTILEQKGVLREQSFHNFYGNSW